MFSTTMFWNKPLLVANIDRIYYIMDCVFKKCPLKPDRIMLIETKTNIRNLQNMIETYKLTQYKHQIYDKCNVALRNFTL